MAELVADGGGNPTLGFGSLHSSDDLSALEAAARIAPKDVWLRLYLTLPHPWRASSLVQAAGLKRATDHTMAMEWRGEGTGLGERSTVIAALVEQQTGGAETVTWQLDALPWIPSQGGLQSLAPTAPPFGWEWPAPQLPAIRLPELVAPGIPWVPVLIAAGVLLILVDTRI